MNAVIYARYSCDNQREESIDGQLRECKIFAEKKNMKIVHEYIDRAFSAKTDNRPEFQQMIKDSFSKSFDAVIVWKLDRFARNRFDSAKYKAILRKNSVSVISATENISKGAEGIILEAVLEGFAEYYSAELSEKVTRGMRENALKCKYNGGNVPIGFFIDKEKKYQIDATTAPIIQQAFYMVAYDMPMKSILQFLNYNEIRTSKNNQLTYGTIQAIFSNRKYIGEYQYKDIVIPDGIPAIIPKDIFDMVQHNVKRRKRKSDSSDRKNHFILFPKLFCGKCKSIMRCDAGTSHNGTVYNYYKCHSVKHHDGCNLKSPRKEVIEREVLEHVARFVFSNKENVKIVADELQKISKKENTTLLLLQKQQSCVNNNIKNILNAISKGIYTESVQEKLLELEKHKAELEEKIRNEKDNILSRELSFAQVEYWLQNQSFLCSEEVQKNILSLFVDKIYYLDD